MNMENVCSAVKYFSRLSGAGYKYVATEFDKKLEELSEKETGLSDVEITILLRVLTRATLSIKRFQKLLHCVVPETTMQKEHIQTVVVWMLMKHVSEPPKKSIAVLQWLIALLENELADRQMIGSFYQQIYFLTFIESLARWASKIIYLLTTPDDITRVRVVRLLSSRLKQPRAHHIEALLGLFKSFRPELIPERVSTVNTHTAFGRIPAKLSEAVNKRISIHRAGVADPRKEINHQTDAEHVTLDDDSSDSESSYPIQKVKRKRKSDSLIPPPVYISVGSKSYSNRGELTVDYFRSLEPLARFELSVETPNVTISLLRSELGRHMLTFHQNTLLFCFSYQLHNILDEVFLKCRRTYPLQEKRLLLKNMAALQDYAHQPLSVVSLFVKEYLFLWESGLFVKQVLKLMYWLQFSSHTELQQDYLSPLYNLFMSSSVKVKCAIIRTLAQLFSNLMLARHYRDYCDLFLHVIPEWNPKRTYVCILKFASYMFGQGFSQAESTAILLPEVLMFYEKVLTAIEVTHTQLCVLPPLGLLLGALSSYDGTVLSRVCQLLTRCNSAVTEKSSPEMKEYFEEVSQTLKQYNAEMHHTLKGGIFPADGGIFSKWIKRANFKTFSVKPIILEVRQHPAITSVMWPILNQQSAEPHVSRKEVDDLSTLRNHLPYVYNYLMKP
ncbi:centromere protein I-like isoform X2 [Schistocerca americana]|uniref:centromere protein I-like isoform X2 n=1 Tax=Schistocerca americana TaxID=7009 RepID=UPI001F4FE6F4|nr:centromere protein I-like isoform X2 [Schistocerca americana]